ncbi:glycoside hydrolase family 32 protein [Rhodotorula graminis WP1]|uniref:Glycoside hydrolase family 32 protein n=1 Tax=Rhodotorula graminis (strain WP1) TaxID=578459 RepID=A0A0P9ERP3_RHOGW|nr:glycoside hydrolase family 32 protein [Rhodotorula graminis WP1]KPV72046.1 glycoside hydrolase family 32 protein [Rhodotorula graminis WP1]
MPPTAVPTGVAPTGDYSGPLRPQVHFSPPVGFMNDPNGLFQASNGTYHLYYQYNPTALVAGNQHWGHATSDDLYTWTNQPIALFPPSGVEGAGVFSGSAVIDTNNTSGFFGNLTEGVDPIVAIYTLNTPEKQTQDIAYSLDGGYTFTEYENNPVLDINSTQFRDPKTIWHEETGKWVMAVTYSQEFAIGIYTSPNLIEWEFASNFSHAGLLGLQYECSNLVPVPVKDSDELIWVMYISINPGAPLGGSVGQYFPGTFNGTHFEAFDAAARIDGFGKDNYASQFFYGTPANESISIGWASNWQYTNLVPTAEEGWRSSMATPRRHYVTNATRIGYVLASEPYQIESVRNSSLLPDGAESASIVNTTVEIDLKNNTSGAVYFALNFTIPDGANVPETAAVTLTMRSSASNETLLAGHYLGGSNAGTTWVDRGKLTGFEHPLFSDKVSHTIVGNAESLSGIFDRSLFEVFVNGGEFSATSTVFPSEMLDTLEVTTTDLPEGADVSAAVWGLRSTWAQQ